ncbi:hypothetical protein ACI6Q2_00090 [Chitinophagaceae bacterium LWZ2-11]
MKKILNLSIFMLLILFVSCTKNNDAVKVEMEKALPAIEVTGLGLPQQVGPFAQTDAILVYATGALTNAESGAFDVAWYDAPTSGTPKLVDSTHFNSWTVAASTATANNAITTAFIQSTYPNTMVYTSSLVLKLAKLPAGSKSYSLRVYARTKDNQMATVSLTKIITVN